MDEMGFGVGCYTFTPVEADGDETAGERPANLLEWWKDKLEEGLGQISSITNLSVEVRGLSAQAPPRFDLLDYEDPFDIDYHMHPGLGSKISFTVTIPDRMQAGLMPWKEFDSIGCERFGFCTMVGPYGPVSFVYCIDEPSPEASLKYSSLVVLVRKFLEKEIERAKASVRFHVTGPSPFWANFRVRHFGEGEEPGGIIWRKARLGYDNVEFLTSETRDLKEATLGMFESLSHQFSYYYRLVRERRRRYYRSELVSEMAEELIEVHQGQGVRAWARKTFKAGGLAQDLLLAAIRAKQLEVQSVTLVEGILGRLTLHKDLDPLREKCQKEAQSSYKDKLDSAQEVAKLLEGGRMKKYEVFMLTVATIFGGAAGAAAALIAS